MFLGLKSLNALQGHIFIKDFIDDYCSHYIITIQLENIIRSTLVIS